MPKDANGTVPLTKNQRNKAAKAARLAKAGGGPKYGGKCTRCGQESSSSTPGKAHLGCPEDKSTFGFELAWRLRAPFLRKYVGPNGEGVWLSKEDFEKYEIEVDAYVASVRNFNTANNQWENGYGEPINFLTREVIETPVVAVSESISVETQSVQTPSVPQETASVVEETTQAA